jgi:subtilisin family serine protease
MRMPFNRFAIVAAVTAAIGLFSPPMATAQEKVYVEGELLVKYKTTANARARGLLLQAAGAQRAHPIADSRIHRVILGADATVEQAMAVYANDPAVEFAEPNYILTAQAVPDDPSYGLLWGLNNTGQVVSGYVGSPGADIGAQSAWDVNTGSATVLVAVVDTGCDMSHPDIVESLWTNPDEIDGNGIDDDGNGFVDDVHGWDFMDDDDTPQDASGHGTHVAGIIAASSDNGRGVAGTAWNVKLLPLRFMDAFSQGTTSDAILAITYAVAQGARIINCSWGGSGYSASLNSAMTNADALFICAAGNSGANLDNAPFYPAGFTADNVLSVAASDQMDRICWFSNYSTTKVDVAAPGIRIYSLMMGRQTRWSENFEDGDLEAMTGWITGGSGDTWGIAGPPGFSAMTTLALNPEDDYENNADTWVQTPPLDLSEAAAATLTFRLIGSSESDVDFLYLDVSTNASTWYSRPLKVGSAVKNGGISGTLPYFSTVMADLGPWDHTPQLYLRFRFHSDGSTTGDGFYIDDLALRSSGEQDTYLYMQGTSMAAGYVSGIAALIKSANDALTPAEIRAVIEESADRIDELDGYTATGGRVNADRALALQEDFELSDSALNLSGSSGGGGGGGCFISHLLPGT